MIVSLCWAPNRWVFEGEQAALWRSGATSQSHITRGPKYSVLGRADCQRTTNYATFRTQFVCEQSKKHTFSRPSPCDKVESANVPSLEIEPRLLIRLAGWMIKSSSPNLACRHEIYKSRVRNRPWAQ